MNVGDRKDELRREISERLKLMDSTARERLSSLARNLLAGQPTWTGARAVLFYSPRRDELDLWPMVEAALASGKRVALPRYRSAEGDYDLAEFSGLHASLKPGRFGIPEPSADSPAFPANQLDLALVPGVAFDPLGRRLGRGRGFYDRILATLGGVRCGVGFDQQIIPEVPVASHDAYVNCILTPTRWLQF
jgi:5-formyltetrahydrofolate cyclo-ligase